jgi:hypothetical protein
MRLLLFTLLAVTTSAVAQGAPALGEWRGQAQYNATVKGQPDKTGNALVAFTIDIHPQGKVLAASSANGCRFVGLSTPGPVPSILNLDVTATGCGYAAFNQRLTGTLAHYERDKTAILDLHSPAVGFARAAGYFEVRATLRR